MSFLFWRSAFVILCSWIISADNNGKSHCGLSSMPLFGWMPTMMLFIMSNPSKVLLAPMSSLL